MSCIDMMVVVVVKKKLVEALVIGVYRQVMTMVKKTFFGGRTESQGALQVPIYSSQILF